MAVAFDADATLSSTANAVTTKTLTTLTVGSGANRALLVQVSWGAASLSISGITVVWDAAGTNQSCTVVTGASATHGTTLQAALYGLVAPTSGNKIVTVTWTGSADVVINAFSVTGADQTGGATTFAHGTSANIATSGNPLLNVTSAVGNLAADCLATSGTPSAPSQTQTHLNTTPANESAAGSRAAGAASVQFNWTDNASAGSIQVGCDIVASGGAPVDTAEWRGCYPAPRRQPVNVGY